MKEAVARVRCTFRDGRSDELKLFHDAPQANVKLALDQFYKYVLGASQNPAIDLIRIASFVYVADTSFTRGGETDVYQQDWPRSFDFRLPILEPDRWADSGVRSSLIECLRFLTGDDYKFTFVEWSQTGRQGYLELFKSANERIGADCVSLFSGGLDSLCAAARLLESGKNPLLISHRSGTRLMGARRELLGVLRETRGWRPQDWAVEIHRIGAEAREPTQRSRAFLYAALGVAAAISLGLTDVYLSDNGIVSLNLVFSRLASGTALTRSTHPMFIRAFNSLLAELGFGRVCVENTLLDLTKGDVLADLERLGLAEVVPFTISCARPRMTTVLQAHCGTCSQCLDRRFGSEFAGLSCFDDPQRYAIDAFSGPLAQRDLSTVEGLVRWAREMAMMSADGFVEGVPQVLEAVVPEAPADEQLQRFYSLHLRHANQVLSVMSSKYNEYRDALARGSLPPTCLLRIATNENIDELDRFVAQLGNRLQSDLPAFFRHEPATNETQVQDAVDALLRGWVPDLTRENPTVRFATRNFRPDFSRASLDLSIEVKFPRDTRRINRIVNEMASDAHVHRKAGTNLLFVVYDPERAINDDAEFERDFVEIEQPRMFVKIVR